MIRYRADLVRYAQSLTGDPDLAEDLVQQSVANTLERLDDGATIANLEAWLIRCVRNLYLDHARREHPVPLAEASHLVGAASISDLAAVNEQVRAIRHAVGLLPDHLRTTFLLAEVRGLDYDEIATVMNRSVGSVGQMLRRARKLIRAIARTDALPACAPIMGLSERAAQDGLIGRIVSRLAAKLSGLQNGLGPAAARHAESLANPGLSLFAAALLVATIAGPPSDVRHSTDRTPAAAAVVGHDEATGRSLRSRRLPDMGSRRSGDQNARLAGPGATGEGGNVLPVRGQPRRRSTDEHDEAQVARAPAGYSSPVAGGEAPLGKVLVSLGYDGSLPNGPAGQPTLTAGATQVAFPSAADNLVRSDTNRVSDIYVTDLAAMRTRAVSVDGDGRTANGASDYPSISADGATVAYSSAATNLVSGDTNGLTDVFVAEMSGESVHVERINLSAEGAQSDAAGSNPSISGEGRYVAFTTAATNLLMRRSDEEAVHIGGGRVRDGQTHNPQEGGENEADGPAADEVATTEDESQGREQGPRSLNAEILDDENGVGDVYLHDRSNGELLRVSVTASGTEANGASYDPAISGDGRYIAFASTATNLVAGDDNGQADVFVYDRVSRTTELISRAVSGGAPGGTSEEPALNAGGRYVAYTSDADNIDPGDADGQRDVYVFDRELGVTRLASSLPESFSTLGRKIYSDPAADSSGPSITASGRFAAFQSPLYVIDSDAGIQWKEQILIADLSTGAVRLAAPQGNSEWAWWATSSPAIEAAGAAVAGVVDLVEDRPHGRRGAPTVFLRRFR